MKFCKKYVVWDLVSWKKVLWSDEATFSVTHSVARRVYCPPGSDANLPQYTMKTVKYPPILIIWATGLPVAKRKCSQILTAGSGRDLTLFT